MTTDTAVLPTVTTSDARPPASRAAGVLRQLGVDTGYTLVGFPLAIAAFVVVVTGLAVGAGLLVIWVGRGRPRRDAARRPRASPRSSGPGCRPCCGRPGPPPGLPRRPRAARCAGCSPRCATRRPGSTRCTRIVRFPLAILAFVVTVTFWSVALGGLTYGAWDWALPDARRPGQPGPARAAGLREHRRGTRIVLYTVIGVVFAVLLPFVVRGVALLQAQLGRALLTSRAATQAELGRLTEGRDAAVAAEAVALRRLERDIHDGPQQRLVRLGMDLGRAQRQLDRDPAAPRAPRSPRPPAWPARPSTSCARCPAASPRRCWPTAGWPPRWPRSPPAPPSRSSSPSTCPTERLAPVVENTAYFVVTEALANVAKHSDATTCRVDVRCAGRAGCGSSSRTTARRRGARQGARPGRARRPAAAPSTAS